MRYRAAKKLRNRDEVMVRTEDGWEPGYVLGEPKELPGLKLIIVPVQTQSHGWREVDHLDVR